MGIRETVDRRRMTIINSVLSAMPINTMSFLPIPKTVVKQLQSLQCNFLWGGDDNRKKLA